MNDEDQKFIDALSHIKTEIVIEHFKNQRLYIVANAGWLLFGFALFVYSSLTDNEAGISTSLGILWSSVFWSFCNLIIIWR